MKNSTVRKRTFESLPTSSSPSLRLSRYSRPEKNDALHIKNVTSSTTASEKQTSSLNELCAS